MALINPNSLLDDGNSWLAITVAALIAVVAARAFIRTRGTTLAAPTAWAMATAAVLVAVEAVEAALIMRGDVPNSLTASIARYAAATGTFCPLMAVLGAKRPQDRGWQWVVLAMWIVLLVPAGQTWASPAANRLELSGIWLIMLAILLCLGLLNYLPTRRWWAAVLVTLGQYLLLCEFLATNALPKTTTDNRWAGLAMILVAAAFALPQSGAQQDLAQVPLEIFNRRWLDFRDNWGAFWALRILQRINESAELSDWPVRLEWRGFVVESDGSTSRANIDDRMAAHIRQTMDSLLRRFERIA